MDSFPGRDSLAPNSSLHQKCTDLLSGKKNFSVEQLERLRPILEYRLSMMFFADRLVVACSLPLPGGKFCKECNDDVLFSKYDVGQVSKLFERTLPLFVQPLQQQGRPGWVKPRRYIVAALLEANLTNEELDSKVEELVECKHPSFHYI